MWLFHEKEDSKEILKFCKENSLNSPQDIFELVDSAFKYRYHDIVMSMLPLLTNKYFNRFRSNCRYILRNNLWTSCLSGNMNCKDLYSKYAELVNYNIHCDNNGLFKHACCSGHLEFAKWLLTLDSVDSFHIHLNGEYILKTVCERGLYDMAKWLLTIDNKYDYYCVKKIKNIKRLHLIVFINNRHLTKYETEYKEKILNSVKIIEKFMFESYYKPNGIKVYNIIRDYH